MKVKEALQALFAKERNGRILLDISELLTHYTLFTESS